MRYLVFLFLLACTTQERKWQTNGEAAEVFCQVLCAQAAECDDFENGIDEPKCNELCVTMTICGRIDCNAEPSHTDDQIDSCLTEFDKGLTCESYDYPESCKGVF